MILDLAVKSSHILGEDRGGSRGVVLGFWDPQKDPQNDPQKDPQNDPQKDPQNDPQNDPQKDPQNDPQKGKNVAKTQCFST